MAAAVVAKIAPVLLLLEVFTQRYAAQGLHLTRDIKG